MKKYAPFLLGGAACLPLTYEITRNGTWLLSGLIVVLLGLSACFVARYLGKAKIGLSCVIFSFGAVCSSISFYIKWYKEYGHKGEDLSHGQSVFFLEGGLISVIGILTIVAFSFLAKMQPTRH